LRAADRRINACRPSRREPSQQGQIAQAPKAPFFLRQGAKEAEDDYWREMDRAGPAGGKIKTPPPLVREPERTGGGVPLPGAGDYDWLYSLSRAEQKRLRENWFTSSSGASSPDEVESRGLSMSQLLALTRGIDAARAVRVGRGGNAARYGNRSAASYVRQGRPEDHGEPMRRAKHRDETYHDVDRNADVQYFTDKTAKCTRSGRATNGHGRKRRSGNTRLG
jgi:hypothetical protein